MTTVMDAQRGDEAEGLATTLDELARLQSELNALRQRQAEGFAVDFNDFSYQPKHRDFSATAGGKRLSALVEAGRDDYFNILARICTFNEQFRRISILPDPEGGAPHWENWWLPGLDACLIYGMIGACRPKTYMEIGSGNSTRFARRAIEDFGLSTRIVSIDPRPISKIDALCDTVIRSRCEDAPLSTFEQLEAGDILFIDNSHRSFQNSDVTVCFTEVIPSLAKGVVYGVHDIFLPWDYPADWENRFYNEQYLMAAYLLGGADGDTILLPGHYLQRDPAFAALRNRLFLGTKHIDWLTSSFWMTRGGHG